jgi:fructoselysine 6-kinase
MRICGVGDNVVDRYVRQGVMFPGGNAVNFAVHARRSGCEAAYLGVVGTDAEADLVVSSLRAEGVETARLRVVDGQNAFATVLMDEKKHREWGVCEKGVSMFALDADDLAYLAGFDLVHTGETSRLDGQLAGIEARTRISFDMSSRDLAYAETVLPHLWGAAFSRAHAADDEVAATIARAHAAGVELVTVTQGDRGATVSLRGRRHFEPAAPADIVDTLGAGDAFVARLAVRVLGGAGLEEAAREAAEYSARICEVAGAFGHARAIARAAD